MYSIKLHCLTIDPPSPTAVNFATLPDLILDNIFEYVDSNHTLACVSYASKRLHHIANRFLYCSVFDYGERKDLLRWSLRANPANIQYIRYYESYDPESLQELWSAVETRLHELLVDWPPECPVSSIIQCIAAKHSEFAVKDLILRNVKYWDYLLLSFTLSFTNLVSVRVSFEELQFPPTAQLVVDILNSLPLKSLVMIGVSDWRLNLGEKLPNLEHLRIYANDSVEEFDGDCWCQLLALMNRSIRYDCSLGEGFECLYKEVLLYAKLENLDPTPLVRWLAAGQTSPEDDLLVNLESLDTSDLIMVLSSITDMQDLRLRLHLYPDCVREVFHLIPLSVKYLIFASDDQVSPSLFLEFFRSLSKVESLKLFISFQTDGHIIWPAGYFTNASISFSNHVFPRLSLRAHYVRGHLPRWVIDGDDEPLVEQSIDSSGADFINFNEEIMGWFGMKESLKYVEILCTGIFYW